MARTLKDFGTRSLSALALGIVMLAALASGVWGIAMAVAVVSAFACNELLAMVRTDGPAPTRIASVLGVAAMPFAAAYAQTVGLSAAVSALLIAMIVLYVACDIRAADAGAAVAAAIYVGFSLTHLVLLRQMPHGLELTLVVLVSVWANDVLAYVFGSLLGTHKMAPRISPNKSWEGLAFGTFGTLCVWALSGPVLNLPLSIGQSLSIGALASAAAVFGDLAESRIKREAGVKDSGSLIPGHGGFLDRFDSLTMVGMVVYNALSIIGCT